VRFHVDYWFANIPSLRGNTACLSIVEGKTSVMVQIPVKSKRPPVKIFQRFIKICRRAGLPFSEVRVDEDGAFIRSTTWCEAMADMSVAVQSTAGYNSENNGQVEVIQREVGKTVRSSLIAAGLPDSLWDFAAVETSNRHNLSYNSGKKAIPLQKLYEELGIDKKGDYNSLILFGSKMHHVACPKKKLESRSRDPRDFADQYTEPRHQDVNEDENALPQSTLLFIGFGNHFRILKGYDPLTRKIVTVMHAGIDEAGITISPNEPLSLNQHLIQSSLAGAPPSESLPPMRFVRSSLVLQQKPPSEPGATEYEVTLPRRGIALGIQIDLDDTTALPYIERILAISPLYDQINEEHRHGAYVVTLGTEEPSSAEEVKSILDNCRKPRSSTTITVVLARRYPSTRTSLDATRAYHDSLLPLLPVVSQCSTPIEEDFAKPPPIIASSTAPVDVEQLPPAEIMTNASGRTPVLLPEKPDVPSQFHKALQTEHAPHWRRAARDEYDRNHKLGVYSKPVCRSTLPSDTTIIPSVLVPGVKKLGPSETGGDYFTFAPRHCARGDSIRKEDIPLYRGNPVATSSGIRQLVANAAADGDTLIVYDVANAFQHTMRMLDRRDVYITLGPIQRQWFLERFPVGTVPEDDGSGYVVQLLTEFQGLHDAGKQWYLLLRKVLIDVLKFKQSPEDPGLLRLIRAGAQRMNVALSTDDCLVAYNNQEIVDYVDTGLDRFFDIKKNTGSVISFLNLRIIQSPYGISLDQTELILEYLSHYFSRGEKVNPCADFWDDDLEDELYNGLILEGPELRAMEKEHRGSLRHHGGKWQHIAEWSRPDFMYFCNRLSGFYLSPTHAAFKQVKKAYRGIAGCYHRPLFYPRGINTREKSVLKCEVSVGLIKEHTMSNHLAIFADSGERRSLYDNKAIGCTITTFGGTATDWKNSTLRCQHTSSTDAELQTYYIAARLVVQTRPIQNFLGSKVDGPVPIYEDSEPTIKVVKSTNPTSRIRHIATYASYSHEQESIGNSEPIHVNTNLQLADIGTKNVGRVVRVRLLAMIIGLKHYPPNSSNHYKFLQLDEYNKSFRQDDE